MKKVEMTLCYFLKDDEILLPLKKKKIGKGKHNGVGGRLEEGETHEQAMIRECIEEVGLQPTEYEYMAELSFNQLVDDERTVAVVYVYVCRSWIGNLIETDEMKPYWFDINNIPYDKTMDDDKYWLPLVLSGKKIIASFELDEKYVTLNHNIEEQESNNLKEKAKEYAIKVHDKQRRKSNGKLMIYHPLAVGELLEEFGYDNETISAGYLHDTVEDTKTTIEDIEKLFGSKVSKLVLNASEPDKSLSWEERKLHTINVVKENAINDIVVIIADKIHNIEDLTNEVRIQGRAVFDSFNREIGKTLWYYEEIYNAINDSYKALPIVKRLNEAITRLKAEI